MSFNAENIVVLTSIDIGSIIIKVPHIAGVLQIVNASANRYSTENFNESGFHE